MTSTPSTRRLLDGSSHGLIRAQVKAAIRAVPDTVLINAREVQCGDQTASPVDVAIAIVFKNGRRAMCGIPMAMTEVRQEDVALCINEIHDEFLLAMRTSPGRRRGRGRD